MERQRVGASFHYHFNLEATGTRQEVFFCLWGNVVSVVSEGDSEDQKPKTGGISTPPDFKKLLLKCHSI